jgi:hypothetical protein
MYVTIFVLVDSANGQLPTIPEETDGAPRRIASSFFEDLDFAQTAFRTWYREVVENPSPELTTTQVNPVVRCPDDHILAVSAFQCLFLTTY